MPRQPSGAHWCPGRDPYETRLLPGPQARRFPRAPSPDPGLQDRSRQVYSPRPRPYPPKTHSVSLPRTSDLKVSTALRPAANIHVCAASANRLSTSLLSSFASTPKSTSTLPSPRHTVAVAQEDAIERELLPLPRQAVTVVMTRVTTSDLAMCMYANKPVSLSPQLLQLRAYIFRTCITHASLRFLEIGLSPCHVVFALCASSGVLT